MSVIVNDPEPGIRQLLLDRPEKRNALDPVVVDTITRAIDGDDHSVVVLGSTSSGAFSSGADLDLPPEERAALSDSLYGLYSAMVETPSIIIAASTGPAVGGGAQLLLASDLRFLSPEASIRFMGAGHGLAVGAWGLPGLVGRGRALELCLSMRTVSGEEALELGLADRLCEDPLAEANEFARHLLELDGTAIANIKRIARAGDENAVAMERRLNADWSGDIPRTK